MKSKHLEGTTYFKHMWQAMKWSYMLIVGGVLGFLHSIFPFIYKDIITSTVDKVKKQTVILTQTKRKNARVRKRR